MLQNSIQVCCKIEVLYLLDTLSEPSASRKQLSQYTLLQLKCFPAFRIHTKFVSKNTEVLTAQEYNLRNSRKH